MMNFLKVFVDGIITRIHGDSWESQVEDRQSKHVGNVVPVRMKKRFMA